MNSSKHWLLAGVVALLAGSLNADNGTGRDSLGKPRRPIYSDITPLAGPIVHNWAEFYVTADFIYWQAREEGLTYAREGNYNYTGLAPASAHHGNSKTVHYDGEPGFKAGIGVDFRHDGWDLYANYSWLEETDARSHVSNDPKHKGQLVSTYFFTTTPGDPATTLALSSAKARWKLHFNTIDIELGRNFYISRHLALRPYAGMKGAWISQKYRVYNKLFSTAAKIQVDQKQEFSGVGLRGGLGTEWHFTRNWSIYGNIAISELYSLVQTRRKDTASGAISGVIYDIEDNIHTIKPVLEMGLGFRYETFFCNDRYQLFLQAGWEEQFWFSHYQLINVVEFPGGGDLVLQGLDVKLGFSF